MTKTSILIAELINVRASKELDAGDCISHATIYELRDAGMITRRGYNGWRMTEYGEDVYQKIIGSRIIVERCIKLNLDND